MILLQDLINFHINFPSSICDRFMFFILLKHERETQTHIVLYVNNKWHVLSINEQFSFHINIHRPYGTDPIYLFLFYCTILLSQYILRFEIPHHIHLTCYKKNCSLDDDYIGKILHKWQYSALTSVLFKSRQFISWKHIVKWKKNPHERRRKYCKKWNQFVVTYAKGSCLTDHVGCNMSLVNIYSGFCGI